MLRVPWNYSRRTRPVAHVAAAGVRAIACCVGTGLLLPVLHADEPRLDDNASQARVKRAAEQAAAGPLRQQLTAWWGRDQTSAEASSSLPRFETHVLVEAQAPASLQRLFEGFEPRYGPTFGSAPNHQEMWREMSPRQTAAPLDLLAVAKAVADLFHKDGPERFFVYRASDATRDWLMLREGDLPAATRYGSPGVTFELLGGFATLKAAQAAYERIEDALGEQSRRGKRDARQRARLPEPVGPPTPTGRTQAAPSEVGERAAESHTTPQPFVRP
jgi:hypothetical protein